MGTGMEWRLAPPSLVEATYIVSDLPEERMSSRALPSAPGRELIASGRGGHQAVCRVLRLGPAAARQAWTERSVPPNNSQEKVGDLELPF